MSKGIILIVTLIGIALGISWYVTAQESPSLQKPLAEDFKMRYNSECPAYECP